MFRHILETLVVITALIFGAATAHADQTFSAFLAGQPAVVMPLTQTGLVPVIEAGITKQATISNLLNPNLVNNGVMVTSNAGVPSISTSIPVGMLIGTLPVVGGPLTSTVGHVSVFNSAVGRSLADSVSLWSGSYVAPSGTYVFSGAVAAASYLNVLGTTGVPDTTPNATLVVQRIGSSTDYHVIPAAAFLAKATNTAVNSHLTAALAYVEDGINYGAPGSFMEGIRGECHLLSTSLYGQCNAGAFETNIDGTLAHSVPIAVEAALNNNTGADPNIAVLDPASFGAAYMASCGDHGVVSGGAKCDNAFLINPNNGYPFLRGFVIPQANGFGGLAMDPTGIGIQINASISQGLKLDSGVFSSAAITLPKGTNGGYIKVLNNAGNTLYQVLYLNSGDQLAVGTDTNLAALVLGSTKGIFLNGATFLYNYVTVAALPACGAGMRGAIVRVGDTTAPTYRGALVGGGAIEVPVYCDGAAWTSH